MGAFFRADGDSSVGWRVQAALHGCVLQTVQELDSQPETPTSESAELNNEAESVVVSQPARACLLCLFLQLNA